MGWTFYNASGQQLRNTGTVLATQAEMEAASSTAAFVTPGRTQYHPGVAKAWVRWEQSGAHGITASYNYTSVTDGGTGDTDHLVDTDFSDADGYAVVGMADSDRHMHFNEGSEATTGFTTVTRTPAGSGQDSDHNFVAVFGDQ